MTPPQVPFRRLPQPGVDRLTPTWRQANPARIGRALALSQKRDPGGWFVVADSRHVQARSMARVIAGREVVLWRDAEGVLHAGPGACPHLGALLDDCPVTGRDVVCRWHGMALPADAGSAWREYPAHDDGVLAWIRLPTAGEEPSAAPVIPERPPAEKSVAAVETLPAVCEPEDIIANRLDPWHGAWFHPYSFSHLTVDEDSSTDERLDLQVAFRLNRRWAVPVLARFTTPDARTIVMHILEGEGAGSVVETHATPTSVDDRGRQHSLVLEATIAYSDRTGFGVARALAPALRPLIRATARRLWVDDVVYAERRYALRKADR